MIRFLVPRASAALSLSLVLAVASGCGSKKPTPTDAGEVFDAGSLDGSTDASSDAGLELDASSDSGKGNGPDPTGIRALFDSLVETACSVASTCCTQAGWGTGGLANCDANVRSNLDLEALAASVESSRLGFDDTEFSDCIASLNAEATTCHAFRVSDCLDLLNGGRLDGESCASEFECDATFGGSVCLTTPGQTLGVCRAEQHGAASTACAATCVTPPCRLRISSGSVNPSTFFCFEADSLYCDSSIPACAAITAAAGTCTTHEQCGSSSYCDPMNGCTPRVSDGGACDGPDQCVVGLQCDGSNCVHRPFGTETVCLGQID